MNYIVFDLEWNNAYNYKLNKGINEIIEIGAIKLNDSFEVIDTFKQLIKPAISKKLGSRFQNLTHITMEEIKANGAPFEEAFHNFARWCGEGEPVFLSWSTSDLYVLADNFKRFMNSAHISFIHKYADAQSYCMSFIEDNDGNQISLLNCAERFEIEADTDHLHRALEDCFLASYCIKKVFDEAVFNKFICNCDKDFFERLVYKPFFINTKKYDDFDLDKVELVCPLCAGQANIIEDYVFGNNTFRGVSKCSKCGKKFWTFVRAKKTYDDIIVTQRLVRISKNRAKFIH
ncbi:MAG: exonuclease domain-containing protein [Clostridium sp.]|nr:exonuclease domain-containing protein [Clostridium sp.]